MGTWSISLTMYRHAGLWGYLCYPTSDTVGVHHSTKSGTCECNMRGWAGAGAAAVMTGEDGTGDPKREQPRRPVSARPASVSKTT